MTIDEGIAKVLEDGKRIGCVYPDYEESYYIHSNLEGTPEVMECEDGYFYYC